METPPVPLRAAGFPRHQKAGDPDRQVELAAPPDRGRLPSIAHQDPPTETKTCPTPHLIPEAPAANAAGSAPAEAKAGTAAGKETTKEATRTAPSTRATASAATGVNRAEPTGAPVRHAANTSPCH
jgi:hypothetical protein